MPVGVSTTVFFNFPNEIPRSQAWENLQAEIEEDTSLEDPETVLRDRWKKVASENNWDDKRLKQSESVRSIETKIIYQYVFIAIGLGIGLPCLLWYLKSKNSWIESTETGLRSSDGSELKLTQITKFDKKKWEKKGIGILHYSSDDGAKTFVLDDLKFDCQITDQIVSWVESNIAPEMIVNGAPESTSDLPVDNTDANSSDDPL